MSEAVTFGGIALVTASVLAAQKAAKEAQKEAFELTYNAVMAVLTDEAKHYLAAIYGDLTAYITTRIEAEVNVPLLICLAL